MIRADQIPIIKKYGLSCSIQPQFVESDAPWCLDSVPDELHPALYTWKTFLNEGKLYLNLKVPWYQNYSNALSFEPYFSRNL